ncbi:hypothetical protein ACFOLG_05890 [Vogesella facilis]|uniref:Prepilin-type N-terminal cleavage/methylation domain-containing protein n=1 Tax=Vogesella facilis TaxID=1655232 RepID=A0ABV7RD23_9NEIS
MKGRGFSLLELCLGLLLASIVLSWGLASYRTHLQQQALQAATVLLKQDAAYLAEYYARYLRYKQTASTWPPLPHTRYPESGTAQYDIAFGSVARNTDNGYYVLRAVDVADRLRYVELTQTGILKYCQTTDGISVCRLQP